MQRIDISHLRSDTQASFSISIYSTAALSLSLLTHLIFEDVRFMILSLILLTLSDIILLITLLGLLIGYLFNLPTWREAIFSIYVLLLPLIVFNVSAINYFNL